MALGGCAAYYAVMSIAYKPDAPDARLGYLIPIMLAALTVMILIGFQGQVHRSVGSITNQLRQLKDSDEVVLIEVSDGEELASVAKPLNTYLLSIRKNMNRLQIGRAHV